MANLFLPNTIRVPEVPYLTQPIENEELLLTCQLTQFDREGYELLPIEQLYYEANGVTLHTEKVLAHESGNADEWKAFVQKWFEPTAYSNPLWFKLDHSFCVVRYAFSGPARTQIHKFVEKRPELIKLLNIRPKWGADFCVDYVTPEECFELVHWEWDFLNINESHSNNLYKFTHLEEIFYTKVFKVFKFDPCSIFQILSSFEKKSLSNSNSKIRKPKIRVASKILEKIGKENDNENTSASKISCSTVFMKILKMNFEEELAESLELKLPSEYNKIKLKKSNSSNQLTQRINKQSKNSEFSLIILDHVIDYSPCYHENGESCTTSNCECTERGFCEKYCSCDCETCRYRFKGCRCESGVCTFLNCSCFSSSLLHSSSNDKSISGL